MPDRDSPERPTSSGYAERGPGRGDYPGRGEGTSRKPQAEEEASDRSRWRDADPDERSERWSDTGDDALDPEIPARDEEGGAGSAGPTDTGSADQDRADH
ncbi:hypothetical protein [Luteimonas changyuni]|uniref:hypothetical protein n=1 Tax=Luteimonas sp. MJ145 TaxID=3129234 RepID=UPI0031BA2ECB